MAIAFGVADGRAQGVATLEEARLEPQWVQASLRRWCGLFIFFNHDRIYLIHQTAKEFLLADTRVCDPPSGWKWRHCLSQCETELEMARICTDLLRFQDIRPVAQDLTRRFSRYDLVESVLKQDNEIETLVAYAAEHWPSHFSAAQSVVDKGYVDELTSFYDAVGDLRQLWFPIYWQATSPYGIQPDVNALQLAGLLGHARQAVRILQSTSLYGIDDVDQHYNTALIWASRYGHERAVEVLLDKGADVNAQGGPYGNALQAASEGGYETVVQMLLEAGANFNAQGGEYGNALQAASEGGHETVVQILIDKGADINAQGGNYGNALQAASLRGHETVVQMLLDKGADINAQGGWYGSALQATSEGGHETVVQMLLDKGADINAQGGRHGNALQAASLRGHKRVVQMLLNMGAYVNAQGGRYGSALQAASEGGHETVVQMLLETGAYVNAQGGFYGYALQAAWLGGHATVVQMLLDKGAISLL